MTDRELLEKAAKAVGIEVPKKLNNWMTYGDRYGFQWWNMDGTKTEKTFNPLHNYGDALSLAVKLYLVVAVMKATHDKPSFTSVYHFNGPEHVSEPHGDDANAATRRAIVRAAAAIGETL